MTNPAAKLSAVDVQAIFDRSPFIGWLDPKALSSSVLARGVSQ